MEFIIIAAILIFMLEYTKTIDTRRFIGDTEPYFNFLMEDDYKFLLNLKYDGNDMPSITSEIETTGTITKEDEQGNVTIRIEGVNGMINDIEMDAYCSGLGMSIEDSSYKGIIATSEYESATCDILLNNPTTTISNARVFNWNSTISGQCEIYFIGLDMTCDVTGTISFALTPIIE